MQPEPGAQTQTVGRPMEILLVEDNLMDAHLTITALRDSEIKHRLTPIPDGEEAIEFLDRTGSPSAPPRSDPARSAPRKTASRCYRLFVKATS